MPTDSQDRFIVRALRRKKLFLALSIAGIIVAVGLTAYYGFRRFEDPTFPIGSHAVIVVLILLNSRQNLRQYRFASFVEGVRNRERVTGDAPRSLVSVD